MVYSSNNAGVDAVRGVLRRILQEMDDGKDVRFAIESVLSELDTGVELWYDGKTKSLPRSAIAEGRFIGDSKPKKVSWRERFWCWRMA